MRITLLLALCAALSACHPTPQPQPPAPDVDAQPPPQDASAVLDAPVDACAAACAHATALHCPIAEPSPGGVSCADVCRAHTLPGDRWDTACMVRMKACGGCGRR